MANATKEKPQTSAPAQTPDLAKLAGEAMTAAAEVTPRKRVGEVVAGPFEVGGIGEVAVVSRPLGQTGKNVLYAEYTRAGGKSQSIPLAAVARLSEELHA